jgi:membrane protein
MIKKTFLKLCWFTVYIFHEFRDNQCLRSAAGLSYTTLLAITPVFLVVFSAASFFPGFGGLKEQIGEILFKTFLPSTAEAIQQYFHSFINNSAQLTTIGTAGFIVSSILLFITIQSAFDSIFHSIRSFSFIQNLMVFWTLLTLGPLLFGLSLTVHTEILKYLDLSYVHSILAFIPFGFEFLFFLLLFKLIPSTRVRLIHAAIGAIVSSLMFQLLKIVFLNSYFFHFQSFKVLYGTLASIPIFLFWLYLCWAVALLGAQLTACLPDWKIQSYHSYKAGKEGIPVRKALKDMLVILQEFYNSQRCGEELKIKSLSRAVSLSQIRTRKILRWFLRDGIVAETSDGGYILKVDLNHLPLAKLMDVYPMDFPADILESLYPETFGRIKEDYSKNRSFMLSSLSLPVAHFFDEADCAGAE